MEQEESDVIDEHSKKSTWKKKFDSLLDALTLGKHQTSLYFKGTIFHSWRASVIVTLIIAFSFLLLSINVLKDIINQENYSVNLAKVGDKTNPDQERVHALTLADYMHQSETSIEVTVYKKFPNDDQFEANVQKTIDYCDGQSVYLSYIYNETIKSDYMNCTLKDSIIGITQQTFIFEFQIEVPNDDVWKRADYDVDGYIGVYFIMMCGSSLCSQNNDRAPKFNISYYSYYYNYNADIVPARRSFVLTNLNTHFLNLNFIEQRKSTSVFQLSESPSDFQNQTFFKQVVYDRAQLSPGQWTEILLQKNMQEEDEILTMYPDTLWMGLAKIGGYFAFLNIVVILLKILHQQMMTRELDTYLKEQHTTNIAFIDGDCEMKHPPVHEFYSYEKFTQMHNELRSTQIELQEIKSVLRDQLGIKRIGSFQNINNSVGVLSDQYVKL